MLKAIDLENFLHCLVYVFLVRICLRLPRWIEALATDAVESFNHCGYHSS